MADRKKQIGKDIRINPSPFQKGYQPVDGGSQPVAIDITNPLVQGEPNMEFGIQAISGIDITNPPKGGSGVPSEPSDNNAD